MKNFFETFTTAILLVLIVFSSISLLLAQVEVLTARQIHSECVNAVEESEQDSVDDVYGLTTQLNAAVKMKHKNWSVSIDRLEGSNSRDYYLVTLNYQIQIPVFGTVAPGKIEGYAK